LAIVASLTNLADDANPDLFKILTCMSKPKYVALIQNGKIHLSTDDEPHVYTNDTELVRKVMALISEGFAFVDQPSGWPPAAVLTDLQEKGLLDSTFTAITWRGPNDFVTYEIGP